VERHGGSTLEPASIERLQKPPQINKKQSLADID
jgi:hypothetical protein